MKINIHNTKTLAPIAPGITKHFCRSAARLHGLLAFREQLNIAEETGHYATFAEVEADMEEIKSNIAKLANICASLLSKMNALANKFEVGAICVDLNEASLSEVIDACNEYVDELVAQSDYRDWVEETANKF